ncbi:flagellar motor protein MotB [Hymenobacter gummosus]|uniref:Flagellar motor protein MotB n=1 Tax=Hymenobacter gummosus TaxID=1776032 RepID=A0A3S0IKI1_9BACT|nr:OmpA family protein [Hymenobacter gummosus]RTQ46546.1 flagellar motor protein MotB [Hymenobacter gummosus]
MLLRPLLLVLPCLLGLPAAGSAGQALPPHLLLDDAFDDNRQGWRTGRTDNGAFSLESGHYRLLNRQDVSLTYQPLPLNTAADYALEAAVQLTGGGRGGLFWGAADEDNGNVFALENEGRSYVIGRWQKGKWEELHPAAAVPGTVVGQAHALRVVVHAGSISYLIDGTEVWTQAAGRVFGTGVGPYASRAVDLRLDRLRAWHTARIRLAPEVPLTLERTPLGAAINEPRVRETNPRVSPDGRQLYFARDVRQGEAQNLDIFVAQRQPDGRYAEVQAAGLPLNNEGNNAVESITPDGNTALLLNLYAPDGRSRPERGASLARRRPDGQWGLPEPVRFRALPPTATRADYFLAASGTTMLLALDAPSHPQKCDLYVSHLTPRGDWSEPRLLGPTLNTPGDDYAPFLAPDGKTLYFASGGHPGFGGDDIFVTTRLDESWTKWSEPLNLGPGINTLQDDGYFSVAAAGDYAFLVGINEQGNEDLFRVTLPPALRPKATVLLRGRVVDARSGQPLKAPADVKAELLPNNLPAAQATAAAAGKFQLTLPGGAGYQLRVSAPGYLPATEALDLTASTQYGEISRDIPLTPLAAGQRLALNNLFFQQSKADILPTSQPELDRLVQVLKDNPELRIRLEGHTDNQGDPKLNVKLSEDRVQHLRAYLVAQGIAAERLQTLGYGGSKPVAPNDNEYNRRKNRRVELVVLE